MYALRPACVCMQIWLANLHVYTAQTKHTRSLKASPTHIHLALPCVKCTWGGQRSLFSDWSCLGNGFALLRMAAFVYGGSNEHKVQHKQNSLTSAATKVHPAHLHFNSDFGGGALNLWDTFLAFLATGCHSADLWARCETHWNKCCITNTKLKATTNSPRKPTTTTSAIIIPWAYVFEAFPFCCTCWFWFE